MYAFQRSISSISNPPRPRARRAWLSGVTRVSAATPDGESLILWVSPTRRGPPTILFLHGNAGEIADRADRFAFYQSQGYGVAFLSWRGYGGSTGTPRNRPSRSTPRPPMTTCAPKASPPDHIVLVGESLGTGPAVQTAAQTRSRTDPGSPLLRRRRHRPPPYTLGFPSAC
jgi:pimeloyl-ACP methyl ester carboxylesterase